MRRCLPTTWPSLPQGLFLGVLLMSCTGILGELDVAVEEAPERSVNPLRDDAGTQPPPPPSSVPALAGCTASEYRCSELALQRCSSTGDTWELVQACTSPGHCNAAQEICTPDACTNGMYSCSEGVLQRCVQGQWQMDESCDNQALCLRGLASCEDDGRCNVPPSCASRSCQPGQVLCVGSSLRQCNRTGSELIVLEQCLSASLCDTGEERCQQPACEADERRCSDDNVLLRCNPTRTGYTREEICTLGAVCDDTPGNARCIPPSCEPGSYRCNVERLQLCVATGDAWITSETCVSEDLCNAVVGRCDLPRPGG